MRDYQESIIGWNNMINNSITDKNRTIKPNPIIEQQVEEPIIEEQPIIIEQPIIEEQPTEQSIEEIKIIEPISLIKKKKKYDDDEQ